MRFFLLPILCFLGALTSSLTDAVAGTGKAPVASVLQSASPQKIAQGFVRQSIFSLQSPLLTEVSGAVLASEALGGWWVLNDGGHSAELYLLDQTGQITHSLLLPGVKNKDWEDLAAFDWAGERYLLVADTGDNDAVRSEVALWIVKEPRQLTQGSAMRPQRLDASSFFHVRIAYPDGARDVEAVTVDAKTGLILFLSKRDPTPHLYGLPLAEVMKASPRVLATKVFKPHSLGGVACLFDRFQIPVLLELLRVMFTQPTAMSSVVLPDGKTTRFVVLTYGSLYFFERTGDVDYPAVFKRSTQRVQLGGVPQAEAVAFSSDGSQVTVFSEGYHTTVVQWTRQETDTMPP